MTGPFLFLAWADRGAARFPEIGAAAPLG